MKPSEPSNPRRWYALAVMAGALLIGGVLRLWLALTDDGIYWPDEIYQSIEPAHRLVFGYGLVPWEFIDGARNWALPWLIAVLFKLCALFGVDSPTGYIPFIKAFFALVATATGVGCFYLARTYRASPLSAATGAALFLLSAVPIYFGPRAMSEVASALPAVLGLAWVLRPSPRRRDLVIGGSLLGLSVLLRLQCGWLFCVGALAILAGRRDWRSLRDVSAVLAVWALLFGWVDHLTWSQAPNARFGGWFHSAITYLRFHLEGGAKKWGTAKPNYYALHLWQSMPLPVLALLPLSILAGRRAFGLLFLAAAYFALHSAMGHKELRFIYPVLPLFCALSGIGLDALGPFRFGRFAAPTALLFALISCARFHQLTFGELGSYPERASSSAYDDYGDVNRLLFAASAKSDLCGLRIDAAHLAWTGGLSHLHKNVPLYHLGNPPPQTRHFNYVIADASNVPPQFLDEKTVYGKKNPKLALIHLFDGCAPDPNYSWRLP